MPDTSDTSATRVKNFDFDNDTSENIFSHPYVYYMASERLQGEEQFHSKNYLLEMTCSHGKMRLKSGPQKLNFVIAKVISKRTLKEHYIRKNFYENIEIEESLAMFLTFSF